jgi:hypothetical protein
MYASTPMLDAFDAFTMIIRRSPLSTVMVDTDNRTLQTTWTLFALSNLGGERLSSQ